MALTSEICEKLSAESSNKKVSFGNVEKIEYFKEDEKKKTMKRKIQGFIETLDDLSWTIKNDENLKVLIRNQTF